MNVIRTAALPLNSRENFPGTSQRWVVPAGTTHLWEVPGKFSLELSGNAAVRITFMDRAGNVLQDTEAVAGPQVTFASPADCEMVAITCLGSLPQGQPQIAPG